MDVVTIDLETYYDKDYSLSKMTTEAYIRDPRFEIIGVGIKVNDYPADWYSGSEPGKFLKSLDYSRRAILCHNTFFDGAVMSWHFGIKPKIWLDTLSMARPLHGMTVGGSLANLAAHYGLGRKGDEVIAAIGKRRGDFTEQELARYGSYCTNDVELTYALWKKLKPGFPPTEIAVIDQILRMFIEPEIELDVPLLEQHLAEVLERKAQLLGDLDPAVLMSNVKFADALLGLDVLPPMKKSPSTGNLTYAFSKTDRGLTDLLEHPDERVQNLVAARLGTKSTLEETRTKALIGVADRGRLPIMLNYYGAHTGRCSGGDKLNLQNFPSRSGNNSLRKSLKAPPGHVLIASDSSQIEARLVAWLAQQEDLLDAFRQKRDVYSEFATKVYGRPISKANKVERFVGKTCILGLGYGMGADKLQRTLALGQGGISADISFDEAQRIVNLYRNENHRIAALWNKCGQALGAMYHGNSGEIRPGISYDDKGILLPSGFRIQYPMLRPSGSNTGFVYLSNPRDVKKAAAARMTGQDDSGAWTKIYGGKVTENYVQGLAAYFIRQCMAQCRLRHIKVVFQVHDELIIIAPEELAERYTATLEMIMTTPPSWAPDLPLACESGMAVNYGDTGDT